jgi:hypothetical protein
MNLASIGIFRSFSHILAAIFNNRAEFERAWRDYKPTTGAARNIEGRWLGEWVSDETGHSGELKCLLSRVRPNELEAKFLATFRGFFRVGYGACLGAEEMREGFRLRGQSDLGSLAGGIYYYEGEVTPGEFKCTYRGEYDQGIFRLKRLD